MPLLTIGLPVFNGADFIERALRSLLAQSYQDFSIVVSDNASSDTTAEIVRRIAREDGRIRLVQHPRNLGAGANFISLVASADTQFFMWAAADDRWSPDYVERSLALLKANPQAGFASGGIANVDQAGTPLRRIKSFDRLDGGSAIIRLLRYTWMREASGKANIIYSVFWTPLLREICEDSTLTFDEWGGDMALIAAALSRARYVQDERATLYKQVLSIRDIQTSFDAADGRYADLEFGGSFPPALLRSFTATMTRGLNNTPQKYAVSVVLRVRRAVTFGWQVRQWARNLRKRIADSASISG